MILKVICGSMAYGLSLDDSDIDIAIVSESWQSIPKGEKGQDLYCFSPSELMRRSHIWLRKQWYNLQVFFPYDFCLDNDLSKWIAENRECMIQAQLPDVYQMIASTTAEFTQRIYTPYFEYKRNQKIKWKGAARAIHFRNMLYNYAEGMTFAEAHKAQGETRGFLLAVRKGEVPIKLVLEENAKARERAKSVAGFYAEPKAPQSVLEEFKYMVNREVELLDS